MISRRRFLRRSGEASMAITTVRAGFGAMLVEAVNSAAEEPGSSLSEKRTQRSFEIRCDAARAASNGKNLIPTTNGDEERYGDKRASFAKGLPQNELGEVEPRAYSEWLSVRWFYPLHLSRREGQGRQWRVKARVILNGL